MSDFLQRCWLRGPWHSVTAQRATLALWRPLAWLARAAFGVLPVHVEYEDWYGLYCRPLSLPRTLLHAAPYASVRAALQLLINRNGTGSLLVFLALSVEAAALSSLLNRRALTELLRCVDLYCERHPLSAAGWRRVLLSTVLVLTWCAFSECAMTWNPAPIQIMLLLAALLVARTLLLLRLVCPLVFLGQLAADLRQECDVAVQARTEGTVDEEETLARHWRAILVRRHLLQDAADSLSEQQGVLYLANLGCFTAFNITFLTREIAKFSAAEGAGYEVSGMVRLVADVLMVVLMVHAMQKTPRELGRMEEPVAEFCMKPPDERAHPALLQLRLLMNWREWNDGDARGLLHRLTSGKNLLWAVISLTITYAVICFQNNVLA